VAVADHQPSAVLVTLGRGGGEIGVDLSLQGGSQHPPGTLTHDRIQIQAQFVMRLGIGDYTKHVAFLPRRRSPRRRFQDLSSGKVRRAHIPDLTHNFMSYLLHRQRHATTGCSEVGRWRAGAASLGSRSSDDPPCPRAPGI
jgi:hypothetical protein